MLKKAIASEIARELTLMKLVEDKELENSPIVANCRMNRERNLHGTNGYDRDLRFDPVSYTHLTLPTN